MVTPTGPRVLAATILLALVGYTFVLAPRLAAHTSAGATPIATSTPAAQGSREPAVFPPADKDFIGVTTKEGTYDFSPVDAFAKATKHAPAVMMFTQGWAVNTFDRNAFDQIAQRKMLPMLSWEPWDYRDDSLAKDGSHATQPKYQLSRISAGDFDSFVRSYATGVKGLNYHIAIRFAHEMNGFWYPWGANVNGNKSGDYIAAWRHVHDIFTAVGATNVIWVWSANVTFDSNTPLASFYPGDNYVDWLGLSGYYGTAGTQNYRSPDAVFNSTMTELRAFTKKPVVITETGATDSAGLKARWIQDFFQYLPHHPDIIGFIWYEAVRETDWRIVASPAAASAFAAGAADPRYAVTWTGDLQPRETVDTTSGSPASAPSSRSGSPAPVTQSTKPSPSTRATGRTPTSAPAPADSNAPPPTAAAPTTTAPTADAPTPTDSPSG